MPAAVSSIPAAPESARSILRRVADSPNWITKARKDGLWDGFWRKYAHRWGVTGDFRPMQLSRRWLHRLVKSGILGLSSHLNPKEILAKAAGRKPLHPVIISRPPDQRCPLFVLDGTHSLVAAFRRKDKTVECLVNEEAEKELRDNMRTSEYSPLVEKFNRAFNDSIAIIRGTREEMEHTRDPLVARKIATDHLRERPDYYGVLDKAMAGTPVNREKYRLAKRFRRAEKLRYAKEFDESEHPRAADGEFTKSPGGAITPAKRSAERKGTAVKATREGKGKESKIILADGREAPEHIKAAMIPPAWSDVEVYTDPESEVYATARDGKGNTKIVYNPYYGDEMQGVKHYRVTEMLRIAEKLHDQNQEGRKNEATREQADCAWLMEVQATRPGSEADTKGMAKLYGREMTAKNIVVTAGKETKGGKPGKPKIEIVFGEDRVLIKDAGTAAELLRRRDVGESLEDSTFWLKSHGATTLEGRNVVQTKDGIRLQFVGKEGVWHDHLIRNKALSEMLLQRKATSGERGGKLFATNETKLAAYIKTLNTGRFSAKDYRTKRANELAAAAIKSHGTELPKDEKERKSWIIEVAQRVSSVLGNRPQQCLESYINPEVFSVWGAST